MNLVRNIFVLKDKTFNTKIKGYHFINEFIRDEFKDLILDDEFNLVEPRYYYTNKIHITEPIINFYSNRIEDDYIDRVCILPIPQDTYLVIGRTGNIYVKYDLNTIRDIKINKLLNEN